MFRKQKIIFFAEIYVNTLSRSLKKFLFGNSEIVNRKDEKFMEFVFNLMVY